MKRLLYLVLAAAAIIPAGCSKTPSGPLGFPFPDPAAVDESAAIGGLSIELECYLWRDFMPSPVPGGPSRMMAGIKIFETGLSPLPEDMVPSYMWVFNPDGEVWGTRIDDGILPGSADWEIITYARDGPEWPTGIETVVVVKLETGGRDIYIKESGVTVERTE